MVHSTLTRNTGAWQVAEAASLPRRKAQRSASLPRLRRVRLVAWQGAIFGSCIVYIFPPLVYVALKLRLKDAAADPEGASVRLLADEPSATHREPAGFAATFRGVFGPGNARANAHFTAWPVLMVVWGVVSGSLGVAMTVARQVSPG